MRNVRGHIPGIAGNGASPLPAPQIISIIFNEFGVATVSFNAQFYAITSINITVDGVGTGTIDSYSLANQTLSLIFSGPPNVTAQFHLVAAGTSIQFAGNRLPLQNQTGSIDPYAVVQSVNATDTHHADWTFTDTVVSVADFSTMLIAGNAPTSISIAGNVVTATYASTLAINNVWDLASFNAVFTNSTAFAQDQSSTITGPPTSLAHVVSVVDQGSNIIRWTFDTDLDTGDYSDALNVDGLSGTGYNATGPNWTEIIYQSGGSGSAWQAIPPIGGGYFVGNVEIAPASGTVT